MTDPRRTAISVGDLSLGPSEAPEKWAVRPRSGESEVEAHWGEWVRLATRILAADALSRDLEARGDAWDQGHAAGAGNGDAEAVNPFR